MNGHRHQRLEPFQVTEREEARVQSHFDRVRALVTLIALHPSRDDFAKTMALLPMLSEYQRLPDTSDD